MIGKLKKASKRVDEYSLVYITFSYRSSTFCVAKTMTDSFFIFNNKLFNKEYSAVDLDVIRLPVM